MAPSLRVHRAGPYSLRRGWPQGQKKRYRAPERVGKIDPERGQSCLFVMRLQAAAPQFLGKLNWRAEGVNQAKGLK